MPKGLSGLWLSSIHSRRETVDNNIDVMTVVIFFCLGVFRVVFVLVRLFPVSFSIPAKFCIKIMIKFQTRVFYSNLYQFGEKMFIIFIFLNLHFTILSFPCFAGLTHVSSPLLVYILLSVLPPLERFYWTTARKWLSLNYNTTHVSQVSYCIYSCRLANFI